jgi:hypothetical protein
LKVICEPELWASPSASRSVLVLNSILQDTLILSPVGGYFFYQTYPELAKDCLSINIEKDDKSIIDCIDRDLESGFNFAARERRQPVDLWAAHMALEGYSSGKLLSNVLNEDNPVMILDKVREFYSQMPVKTFRSPYTSDEYDELRQTIDGKVDQATHKFFRAAFFREGLHEKKLVGSALCVLDLMYKRLYASYGYVHIPNHRLSVLSDYSSTFLEIDRALRKDAKMNEAFNACSAKESLRYLLGDKVRELNELIGFTPLNPLKLVSKKALNEEVDMAVLKIRKHCKKVRELVEEVHVNCLKNEIDRAVDAKTALVDSKANQSINYSILDNTSEFMKKEIRNVIHEFIDNMIKTETKSNVIRLHRPLKELKKKSGWISEAKFLTFGTVLILAAHGIDAFYLQKISEALGSASLGLGAAGVVTRILEEGMKIWPGFNIYASFVNWPRIVET